PTVPTFTRKERSPSRPAVPTATAHY
ncbi:uncharacterized protein METZ01_LOCUS460687, partial [marine metagenome]